MDRQLESDRLQPFYAPLTLPGLGLGLAHIPLPKATLDVIDNDGSPFTITHENPISIVRSIQTQLTHRDRVQDIMQIRAPIICHCSTPGCLCGAKDSVWQCVVDPGDCLRALPNPEIRRPLTISKAETPSPQRDAWINTQSTALSLFCSSRLCVCKVFLFQTNRRFDIWFPLSQNTHKPDSQALESNSSSHGRKRPLKYRPRIPERQRWYSAPRPVHGLGRRAQAHPTQHLHCHNPRALREDLPHAPDPS